MREIAKDIDDALKDVGFLLSLERTFRIDDMRIEPSTFQFVESTQNCKSMDLIIIVISTDSSGSKAHVDLPEVSFNIVLSGNLTSHRRIDKSLILQVKFIQYLMDDSSKPELNLMGRLVSADREKTVLAGAPPV